MHLIYLSPVPWESFAQRPHKFIEWFHGKTGGEVLWIDPYPTRFPSIRDIHRINSRIMQQQRAKSTWLRVLQPHALPFEPLPMSNCLNAMLWRSVFNELMVFARSDSTLLGIGKPSVLALAVVKRLKGYRSFYDAMDDFPAFYNGFSRIAMRNREKQLVHRVMTVFVASPALKKRWADARLDIRLVNNGLDPSALPPVIVRKRPRETKVLGYVGTIASWFAWDWIVTLAKMFPKDEIRLIGPVHTPIPVSLPPNIELLPPCDHRTALSAMQDFDVGLIPFKKNQLTASVDPIKYYEYHALGLPVISTDFGEMSFRKDEEGVFISDGTHNLDQVVHSALNYQASSKSIARFAVDNSWESRFDGAGII